MIDDRKMPVNLQVEVNYAWWSKAATYVFMKLAVPVSYFIGVERTFDIMHWIVENGIKAKIKNG